jgi:predicted RNA-binding protein YlqC (UPF0109 family)
MKELVEFIARSLVDEPDKVRVRVIRRGRDKFMELRVAPEDAGRVIGKRGQVASSIRTLMRVAAAQKGKRPLDLKIR